MKELFLNLTNLHQQGNKPLAILDNEGALHIVAPFVDEVHEPTPPISQWHSYREEAIRTCRFPALRDSIEWACLPSRKLLSAVSRARIIIVDRHTAPSFLLNISANLEQAIVCSVAEKVEEKDHVLVTKFERLVY